MAGSRPIRHGRRPFRTPDHPCSLSLSASHSAIQSLDFCFSPSPPPPPPLQRISWGRTTTAATADTGSNQTRPLDRHFLLRSQRAPTTASLVKARHARACGSCGHPVRAYRSKAAPPEAKLVWVGSSPSGPRQVVCLFAIHGVDGIDTAPVCTHILPEPPPSVVVCLSAHDVPRQPSAVSPLPRPVGPSSLPVWLVLVPSAVYRAWGSRWGLAPTAWMAAE